jgi:regulator of sigma E protease
MFVLIAIVAFIIILIVLVVAHEFAHFITAKWCGVEVKEFGIGFPPRIWGVKKGETFYSINALPLGGFVRLAGEEDPNVPRSLASKGYGSRILVLASGSLMNIVLPIVIAAIAFIIPHNVFYATMTIDQVADNSPAQMAGIQPGDTILAINGQTITSFDEFRKDIQLNSGKETSITIKHLNSEVESVSLTPRVTPPAGQGAVGILMKDAAISESFPFWEAFPRGFSYCWGTLVAYKDAIASWINGTQNPQVSGIVGMTAVTGEVAKAGISPLLLWAAFISLNLGIVNILPLPALDGGRIAFVFLEIIRRGKRVTPRIEGLIHGIGFVLLMALMLLLVFSDVSKLITTGNVIP